MLASRTFGAEDQARFAVLSGDFNPLHMDPIAARRTQAGAPVVHGIHVLLWLLDTIAALHIEIASVATLKVRFRRMVYLGERVDASLTQVTSEVMRAKASVDGVEVVSCVAELGTARSSSHSPSLSAGTPVVRQDSPCDLAMEELHDRCGSVSFATALAEFGTAFPDASRLMGAHRVAALGCSTYLVGMVVPGLHSIYGGLDLNFTTGARRSEKLCFAVTSVDVRFRRILIQISGGGLEGSLKAFCRLPPVRQPSIDAVASVVDAGEFSSSVALVIGGSRGLGEVAAKMIAAGGGKVIVTYAAGRIDAENVRAQIAGWGGQCEVSAYDVRRDAYQQLQGLSEAPTHLYYFATPTIGKRKGGLCARERLDEFNQFYVHGVLAVVYAARRLRPEGISLFYPSTVYVHERPADMTEYAMSKAAGELLCADIARFMPGMRVITQRLPRLLTDQTASLIQAKYADPLEVMLPIIRKMHRSMR
jgi:acyl dehydratase/NAD(P)-dependent dehydrogenase (short-subunit alcohol dehydrogenase family)